MVLLPASGSWTAYQIEACTVAATPICLALTPACAVNGTSPTTCTLAGLQPATDYTVTAVAQAAGSPDTLPSSPAPLTTRIP